MLHEFLAENRADLIERCRAKVALRPVPPQLPIAMEHGIPKFLEQLIDALRSDAQWAASGPRQKARRPRLHPTDISASATQHGSELLREGYTVDQVVHDYGDLCQAITELAVERHQLLDADEFRTLNGCLDDAIADAVTEYGRQQGVNLASENLAMSGRLAFLAHEMRNCLNAAWLSYTAIKGGHVGLKGATAEVLDRNLLCLRNLIDRPLVDARLAAATSPRLYPVAMDRFVHDVQLTANMDARAKGCEFSVEPVEPGLAVKIDQPMLYAVVSNLLQNAFQFTQPHTHVTLRTFTEGESVRIEIEDECGGLPQSVVEWFAHPADEALSPENSGAPHGLSLARRAVGSLGGELLVRNRPGVGCAISVVLPRHRPAAEKAA